MNSDSDKRLVKEEVVQKRSERRGVRVLVVEDDPTSEALWDYIVRRVDPVATLAWASTVLEAEDLFHAGFREKRPFQVVVSDIYLSGRLTGIDLWRRLYPAIGWSMVLTSSIDESKVQKYLKGLGSPTYLKKPIDVRESIETIYELLWTVKA